MNRYLMAAAFSLFVLPAPAHAASVDMSTQTCQDWLDSDDDEQEQAIAWLRGYLSSKSGSTLYDFAAPRTDGTTLKRYCQNHLTDGVISAAAKWRQ